VARAVAEGANRTVVVDGQVSRSGPPNRTAQPPANGAMTYDHRRRAIEDPRLARMSGHQHDSLMARHTMSISLRVRGRLLPHRRTSPWLFASAPTQIAPSGEVPQVLRVELANQLVAQNIERAMAGDEVGALDVHPTLRFEGELRPSAEVPPQRKFHGHWSHLPRTAQ
jgi:hypothetical protein